MTEQQSEQGEFLFVPNEDGTESIFEVLYEFTRDDTGQHYMLVVPVNEDDNEEAEEEEQEVFAFRYSGDEENLTIEMIEDEAEWEMVQEVFQTWLSQEFQEEVYGDESPQQS